MHKTAEPQSKSRSVPDCGPDPSLRRSEFRIRLARAWPQVEALLKTHKLVNVFLDRVKGMH